MNAELVEAGKVKDHVLAVTNHELRTPLTTILGFADVLLTSSPPLTDDERLDYIQRIQQGGRRMSRLIDDFLFAATLQSGALQMSTSPIELQPVLSVALAQAGALDLTVSVECPGGLQVVTDPDRLAQILTNFLANAVKYGDGPRSVAVTEKHGFAEIRVTDDGPGVDPSFAPSLFEMFSQASRGTNRTTRGTGLGLAIARDLARALGGDAWFEPNHPRGAVFAVRVPMP